MKILHFSDIHVDIPVRDVALGEWFSKRSVGLAHHILRRRRHFLSVPEKMAQLYHFASEQNVDLAICTGDYTVVGTEPELRDAYACVEPFRALPLGLVTVAGNHDLYCEDGVADQRFPRLFKAFLLDRDGLGVGVRKIAEGLHVVSVCSARPNPQPWVSRGRVSDTNLASLREVLSALPRQDIVLVLSHYGVRGRDGELEGPMRRLENSEALLHALQCHPRAHLLHGHIHRGFYLNVGGLPVYCAGSTTQSLRESFWLFEVENGHLRASQGFYDLALGYRLMSV